MSEINYEVEGGGDLARLARLAEELKEAQQTIAGLERDLKAAQAVEAELREKAIPELMDDLGMESFKTSSGFVVRIKESVHAYISKERKPIAYRWLDEHGHGGMLRRAVTVEFNKEQHEQAKDLAEQLRGKYPMVDTDITLHATTLKKWVKGMLERGEDVPLDLFGVHTIRVAKISKK